LYKIGELDKTKNYRGISLLYSAYKIYAEVLRNRLEKEIVSKGMLPESQARFRKGRFAMDIHLDHIIQREKEKGKEERKVYALFVNLKAFDSVEREIIGNYGKKRNE